MCGIAGVVRFDTVPVDVETLREMASALRHRGPDGTGTWSLGRVGFAHTRLSIIGLEDSGQPMCSADGTAAVCFNGEILNYRQLRARLTFPYRTTGDTEVLLAAHATHGADGVTLLRGQFAYALYDVPRGEVVLCRDRLGILPLYYYRDDKWLLFASEPKAIVAALGAPPPVDDDSLDAYLARRAVPAPHTLLRGVRKVRPGHRLVVRLDGTCRETPYWRLDPGAENMVDDQPEAVMSVRAALDDAVHANLVADVPVGAYLSGGLDSSLIAAVATRASGTIDTFAAGFAEGAVDERPWARMVSRHLGTRHHEVVVAPDDFVDEWTRLTWHRDAPLSEPADVAVFRLAQSARRHVKVVLSGEGSDELFGGYPKHRLAHAAALLDGIPRGIGPRALRTASGLIPAHTERARIAARALSAATELERLQAWFAPFTADERTRLLGDAIPPRQTGTVPPWRDALHRQLVHDLDSWLPDNLLERGDRMTMAASVELRPPFLDHQLVELAFRLSSSLKVRRGSGKWVLKEIARDLLPAEVIARRKSGFRVPLDTWFRGRLRDLAFDRLTGSSSFVATRLDRGEVRRLLADHDRGRSNEQMRIWTLLCLEIWHEQQYTRRSVHEAAGAGAPA